MHALAAVEDRLSQHFPDVDAVVVEAAVRLSRAEVTSPIHGFAPLLVEWAARNRLSYAVPEHPHRRRLYGCGNAGGEGSGDPVGPAGPQGGDHDDRDADADAQGQFWLPEEDQQQDRQH